MSSVLEETGLRTLSIARLAEALAEATPDPGGSSAAPVPAVLAAGLVSMAARLSAESDPFSETAYDLEALAGEADRLRAELLELVDEEAAAFERVLDARHAGDAQEIQRAYEAAVEPPLRVCELSLRVLQLAAEVTARGNENAIGDAGVAVVLAAASLEAAALTVDVELGPVADHAFRRTAHDRAEALLASAQVSVS